MPRSESLLGATRALFGVPPVAEAAVVVLGGLLALALGVLLLVRLRRGAPATTVFFAQWRTWAAIAVVVSGAVLAGQPGVAALAIVLATWSAVEYGRLTRLPWPDRLILVAGAAAMPASAVVDGWPAVASVAAIAILGATLPALVEEDVANGGRRVGAAAFGLAWLGGAASSLVLVAQHGDGGPALLLALALAVALSDVGAFVVGTALRGPRLAPRLSPGKTRAGVGGNLIGAAAGFALFSPWVAYPVSPALLAAVVAVGCVWGDLLESMLKRGAGVKDCGRSLPGFGGLLDRVDSLLVVAPLTLVVLAIFGA